MADYFIWWMSPGGGFWFGPTVCSFTTTSSSCILSATSIQPHLIFANFPLSTEDTLFRVVGAKPLVVLVAVWAGKVLGESGWLKICMHHLFFSLHCIFDFPLKHSLFIEKSKVLKWMVRVIIQKWPLLFNGFSFIHLHFSHFSLQKFDTRHSKAKYSNITEQHPNGCGLENNRSAGFTDIRLKGAVRVCAASAVETAHGFSDLLKLQPGQHVWLVHLNVRVCTESNILLDENMKPHQCGVSMIEASVWPTNQCLGDTCGGFSAKYGEKTDFNGPYEQIENHKYSSTFILPVKKGHPSIHNLKLLLSVRLGQKCSHKWDERQHDSDWSFFECQVLGCIQCVNIIYLIERTGQCRPIKHHSFSLTHFHKLLFKRPGSLLAFSCLCLCGAELWFYTTETC